MSIVFSLIKGGLFEVSAPEGFKGGQRPDPESAGGNEVLFVLKAKSGFKLKSIAILNENNEVVDYADLTEELEEGIYVYRSRFVMPNNGVTIKAVWEEIEEEPETPDEPEVVEYEIKNNITGDGKIEVASKAKKVMK